MSWLQIAADQALQAAQGAVTPLGVTIAGTVRGLPPGYANGAFTERTGYPIGDVLGQSCWFLAPVGRTTAAGSDYVHSPKGTAGQLGMQQAHATVDLVGRAHGSNAIATAFGV